MEHELVEAGVQLTLWASRQIELTEEEILQHTKVLYASGKAKGTLEDSLAFVKSLRG